MSGLRHDHRITSIDAEVVRSAMETVCFEMATFVSRTATTPILNQSNERNATILDWRGRLAALSVGIPQFMLSSTLPVRFAIDFFADELYPGDVIVGNDPYHGGGHLPDFNVFAPVFDDDGALLLVASIQCHHGDTGGAMAGGYNVFAKDIWSEGTRYPLLKIVERGQGTARRRADDARQQPPRRVRRRLAGAGGRGPARRRPAAPRSCSGTAPTRCGAAVDWTIDDADRRFSDEIARWPDGIYEADVYVDADPAGNTDIHVHVAVTVDGDRLVVDFAGSDDRPEIQAWSTLRQHPWQHDRSARVARRPDDPEERGLLRLHRPAGARGHLRQPDAGQAGDQRDAPPGCRGGRRDRDRDVADRPRPVRAADLQVRQPAPDVGRRDPRTGRPFFDHGGETNAGWVNAVQGVDGWGALVASNGNLIKASAELNEALFPHILRGRNYRTDSGGAGQWRGGCGSRTS